MSQQEFSGVSLGARYWKTGDRKHSWVVDALIPSDGGRSAVVVLISEGGACVEEVELSHLKDPEQYGPVT
jgi:hypothetical protein